MKNIPLQRESIEPRLNDIDTFVHAIQVVLQEPEKFGLSVE